MSADAAPPAASQLPTLPHTWRAQRTRRVVLLASIALIATITVLAVLMPPETGFTRSDRIAMIVLALVLAGIMGALARSRVTATDRGLTIVNVVLTRRLEWAQIVSIRLSRNDPWAALDLDDGSTVPALAIATSDGERAQTAAAELRALLAANSTTPRDD